MITKISIKKEVNIKELVVFAGVRYWEDATVNGNEDINGDAIPCRLGDYWNPRIDVDTGTILEWPLGTIADIHYKVSDECGYQLYDDDGELIYKQQDGYVPRFLCPEGDGYGDYIIMKVDERGKIANWEFNEATWYNEPWWEDLT